MDNSSAYIDHRTRSFAHELSLEPLTTPVRSPQSNGMAESFVKTMKHNYVAYIDKPDAPTALSLWPSRLNTSLNTTMSATRIKLSEIPLTSLVQACCGATSRTSQSHCPKSTLWTEHVGESLDKRSCPSFRRCNVLKWPSLCPHKAGQLAVDVRKRRKSPHWRQQPRLKFSRSNRWLSTMVYNDCKLEVPVRES